MNQETPRFCSVLHESSFSATRDSVPSPTVKRHISPIKFRKEYSNENKNKNKHNHEHKHKHKHKHKNRNSLNLLYFNLKNYHIDNIYEFIKNHKFNLRNDFDKKNSKKFLLSKEQAFEKPFLIEEENN